MYRRSSVIFAASLALLSTLDSATCFAAAAPAQPREDVDRPRFIKKEIKRFVFTNVTTTGSEPPDEAPTSELETLLDTLTSLSSQDLGADATPTSATSVLTTTPSVTLSDNGQSSISDASLSSAGQNDADREAFLALHPSTTAISVSSTLPPSSSPTGEGATMQSSIVPGGDLDVAIGSSQSLPSSSASPSDQLGVSTVVPQTTQSSTPEQPGNSVSLSQPASTAQSETSAAPSSASPSNSQENPQDALNIAHQSSSSIASQISVSTSTELGSTALGSQSSSSPGQQSDTQVQADTTQGTDTLQSSLSSEGVGIPPTTTSIAVSSSPVLPAGETIVSNSGAETNRLSGAVTTATGGSESSPATSPGAGFSAVPTSAGITISSNANGEANDLTTGLDTATGGPNSLPRTTVGAGPSTIIPPPGTTISSNANGEADRLALAATTASGDASSVPVTSAGAVSPAVIPPVGTTTNSNANGETIDLTSGVNTATGGFESVPETSAGVASSAVVPAAVTTITSSTNQETNELTSEVNTATAGVPLATTSAGSSLAAESGETVKTSAKEVDNQSSLGGESNSGVPASNTGTSNEGSANANTIISQAIPITSGSGASAISTHAAEPASSPVAPQSVAVPATGTNLGSETSPVTSGSGENQLTVTPAAGAGPTSQDSGLVASSASVALQSNTAQAIISQAPGSPPQTTLSNGAVVPNTAQSTGAAKGITTPVLTPPASVSSPGVEPTSSPNVMEPASVANPSVVSAASKLNAIPASVANPLSSIPGNPPSIYNPALPSAATALDTLPISIQNPEHPVTSAGSPNSASPVISEGSGPHDTTGVASSPVTIGSPFGSTELPGPAASSHLIGGGSTPVGTTVSPDSGTAAPARTTDVPGASGSSVSGSVASAEATGTLGASRSPVSGSAAPVGVTEVSGASGPSVSGSASPTGVSGSPVATGSSRETTAGPVSGQNPQNTATGSIVPQSGPITASNGEVISGTSAPSLQSVTPQSGIAGYSTQSNGKVVPVSAAAGTGSTVSNGQIVPAATDHEASGQSLGPSGTGAAAASNSAQSAAAVAAGATQSNAAPPGLTSTPVAPPPQEFTGKGPYTQSPVGYDTSTTQLVPTSIIHGPSSTPSVTQGHYFGPSGLPSNVPQILYQNDGPGPQPPDTRMVNIAFRYPLNYLFVYNHTESQKQIFYYIPLGISYGLEIDPVKIKMQSLRAWDTYEDVGYVTTLALAWIPEGLVDNLGLLVSTPVSRFYRNPDNSTAFLLSMINSAIPITGSNGTDGPTTPFGNIPPDTTSAKNAGAPIGGDIGNSEHVRASSVGIGVGVACGAAAYGAAMFFVARRYKKRRQSHMRSPSMFSSPVMSHAGPDAGAGAALMSGAMGERSASPYYDNDGRAGSRGSGRSGSSRHQISAPVMAENSLGWN